MDSASGLRLRSSSTDSDTDSDDASTVHFNAEEAFSLSVDGFDSLSPSMSFSSTIGDDGSSVYSLDSTCRPQPSLEIEEIPDPTWCWSPTPKASPSPLNGTKQRQQLLLQRRSSWLNAFAELIRRKQRRRPTINIGSGNVSTSLGRQYSEGIESEGVDPWIERIMPLPDLRVFTLSELMVATRSDFKSNTGVLLGDGRYGKVFKGWVDKETLNPTESGDGMIVAVKHRNLDSPLAFLEWEFEIDLLGKLSHPNLVKLLGYCQEDEELLLVYEYMSKGSLDKHLFIRGTTISWDFRLKTAISVARCITFLHSLDTPIICRDVTPSNIFFDHNYNVKLAFNDLEKLEAIGNDSYVSTRVMGTYGYADPSYIATGNLFAKSDVYGFGVILLEILSGLRVINKTRPKEQRNLVQWLKPFLPVQKKIIDFVDRRLEGQYPVKAVYQTARLTLKCLSSDPKMRPSMKQVLQTLQKIEALKD